MLLIEPPADLALLDWREAQGDPKGRVSPTTIAPPATNCRP